MAGGSSKDDVSSVGPDAAGSAGAPPATAAVSGAPSVPPGSVGEGSRGGSSPPPAPPGAKPSDGFDNLIFSQELNEVYLLLDFISGRPDKHFAALDGKIVQPVDSTSPADSATKPMTSSQVIARVSELRYPPDKPPPEKARDAAFLLLVKDALNGIAYPARGMTIAYTTMFTDEDRAVRTSRLDAARLAYPTLSASAAGFRKVKDRLAWFGLFVTVLSALLLYQVTYGAQLAARFDEAKRNETLTAAKVYDVVVKERTGRGGNTANADKTNSPPAVCAPGEAPCGNGLDLQQVCRLTKAASGTPRAEDRSAEVQQVCADYAYRHALLCVAVGDVGAYSEFWLFRAAKIFLPMHEVEPALDCTDGGEKIGPGKGRQEDAPSIAGVLSMMSNYLLPILFGLVGTMAALVRSVQDKVTDSLLAPRDRALIFIRIPLGMVAGISVGLFLAPANLATQTPGGIGNFTLTASGIAFLAGYGAEAFFRAVDAVLGRVFSLESGPSRAH